MVTRDNNEIRYELVAEAAVETPAESPLRMLRRVLRGRLVHTLIGAVLLACVGGTCGYLAVQPKFEASGLMHVRGAVPSILYDTPETQAPPMFDTYLSSLETSIMSPPVLERAVDSPTLRAIGWPSGAAGVARLENVIEVSRGRREQLIRISATASNPYSAQLAANAVLFAAREYSYEPMLSSSDRRAALESRQHELEARLAELREKTLTISDNYGGHAIRSMQTRKVDELLVLESRIAAIAQTRKQLQNGESPAASGMLLEGVGLTHDSRIAALRAEEAAIMSEMRTHDSKYSERHPIMRELRRKLETVRMQVDLQTNSLGTPDTSVGGVEAALARLDKVEARYVTLRDQFRADTTELSRTLSAIDTIESRITETQDRLNEAMTRIDQLAVEAKRGNIDRISIESWAMTPIAPIKDRRPGLATAGIIAGAVGGIALMFLVGLADGRLRYVDELEALEVAPLVGVLPEVGTDRASRRHAHRSVHQLRNLLELQTSDPSSNVVSITSSGHQDGKTSLAIGLATSFAAAGRRTLIIDADVSGRRLTHELGLEHATGLCESIGPGNQFGQVHLTAQEELWAMPVGSTAGINPEELSRDRLVHLLDALRSRFDAIVIDTGPIRSSIEACLVSAVADRVVMVVSRNQTADRLRFAVDRLEQVGARCAGVVFNRALPSDVARKSDEPLVAAATGKIVPLARPVPLSEAIVDEPSTARTDELAFRLSDAPRPQNAPDEDTDEQRRAA